MKVSITVTVTQQQFDSTGIKNADEYREWVTGLLDGAGIPIIDTPFRTWDHIMGDMVVARDHNGRSISYIWYPKDN